MSSPPSRRLEILLLAGLAASCTQPTSKTPSEPSRRSPAPPSKGPSSYEDARRLLPRLFPGPGRTLYCGCAFDARRRMSAAGCGLPTDLGTRNRRDRVEWEHVVPAATFGKRMKGWEGDARCGGRRGRDCMREISARFNRMEGDLYNLRPVAGTVNELRGSRAMTDVPGEKPLGRCDFEVQGGRAEPADAVKGDVARIYLHMEATYPGLSIVDRRDRDDYEKWEREDPVNKAECQLYRRIEKLMGYPSSVVMSRCAKAGL